MYTKGNWEIDGTQIVSVVDEMISEAICELNPETEYPTVFGRNSEEAMENAELIANAPTMYECIREVLELLDDKFGVPNIVWVRNRLHEAIAMR